MAELREIDIEETKRIAARRGLLPGRVRGTEQIRFTWGANERLEVIEWAIFESTVRKRNLVVYESGGWMKIMRRP